MLLMFKSAWILGFRTAQGTRGSSLIRIPINSRICKWYAVDLFILLPVSFKAYDLDGNGFISKDELALMFKSAWISGFRALCASHGNEELSMDDLNEFSEEMATLFADNAFDTLDTNGDGQLSFEEFKEFALAEPKITATLNGFKKEVNITFW